MLLHKINAVTTPSCKQCVCVFAHWENEALQEMLGEAGLSMEN